MLRIGQSTDIHALEEGLPLIIGGVNIPYKKGFVAHSDGDVLIHAICESILGALALGDLGKHFPDTSEEFTNINSMILLERVYSLMTQEGYQINNLDALIIIEEPKMAPHIDKMRSNIASTLHTPITNISIKATCNEKLGYIGRSEGAMAQCIVLLTNL
ncbi:MAG: 2-C-methyl-D-erythritol 2,4-cyclodiphosphate synthase [Erysipelotrichaceae bacterium]